MPSTEPAPHAARARDPRRTAWVLALALSVVMAAAGLVLVRSEVASAAFAVPAYPSYQPQTRCSPWAKPGTVRMRRFILRQFGGADWGIARSCRSGSTSEHYEGRAFDWGLDASRPSHRRAAYRFRHYLFVERFGYPHFRARRMGVMYLIWNRRIYSSYYRYRPRPYYGSSPHRDHMHISLTRAGGWGRTPWFQYH